MKILSLDEIEVGKWYECPEFIPEAYTNVVLVRGSGLIWELASIHPGECRMSDDNAEYGEMYHWEIDYSEYTDSKDTKGKWMLPIKFEE